MAISITNSPTGMRPAYNPIGYTITSTNYAQTNFQFIADVYINSAVSTYTRLKFPAYPGQNYGYIDIGSVLKQYLTSDPYLITESAAFSKNANSILRWDVKFGEEYGPSSGITTYPNLNTDFNYAFNGSLQHLNLGNQTTVSDWINFSSSTYSASGGSIEFLTNAPRDGSLLSSTGIAKVNIKTTEGYALYFFNDTSNKAYDLHLAFYNGNSLLSTSAITSSFASVSTYDTRFLRVAVGPINLGVAGISIPANCTSYYVQLRDNATNATSEIFQFKLDSTCNNASQTYRFKFLNAMGGFDTFTFNGQSSRTDEIKKDFFKSVGGQWSGGNFVYSASDRSEKQYSTVITESFKCSSGWITEAESDWLSELISSPEVYIEHPNGTSGAVSVNIIDANYSYKTISRDQLFNLELTFRPTFTKVRQQF